MKYVLSILTFISVAASAQTLHLDGDIKFLALGDSYTIGQSVSPAERWPVQLAYNLRQKGVTISDPKIIATTGWTTLNLKVALTSANLKNEYNMVSLLIGVNNYFQGGTADDYRGAFYDLLQTSIALAKGIPSHVFVLSIPDYGYTPFGQANQSTISNGIDQFNSINKEISASLSVPYFDITEISRRGLAEPNLVAGDGLHPSSAQYLLWVNKIIAGTEINMNPSDSSTNPVDTSTVVTGLPIEPTHIQLYPNPFNEQIKMENIADHHGVHFKMMTLLGEPVIDKIIEPNTAPTSIETIDVKPGVYVYQVTNRNGVVKSGRLVKRGNL